MNDQFIPVKGQTVWFVRLGDLEILHGEVVQVKTRKVQLKNPEWIEHRWLDLNGNWKYGEFPNSPLFPTEHDAIQYTKPTWIKKRDELVTDIAKLTAEVQRRQENLIKLNEFIANTFGKEPQQENTK
jgi:hypothetical protein